MGVLRRRGGGAGEGDRRLLVGGGDGLLLRLPLLVTGDCHRFPICIRGEVSFCRFRGDGEALREGECLRRLPTSPFFTWDLLGRSSSEEEEEPESDEDCWFCRLYWRLCCTESAAAILPPLSSSDSDNSTFLGFGAGEGDSLFSVPLCFVTLPEVLPGDTETRLFLVRFDCWGVGECRVLGGGVAGGDGLCLRLGGLAEGDNLRVFRGGWMSSWEASLVVTVNEMKRMMSYSQTRMLTNVFFVLQAIYSFYALVEEAFFLVEFFFEEMAAFLGLAAF